jgi:hypothetical protein
MPVWEQFQTDSGGRRQYRLITAQMAHYRFNSLHFLRFPPSSLTAESTQGEEPTEDRLNAAFAPLHGSWALRHPCQWTTGILSVEAWVRSDSRPLDWGGSCRNGKCAATWTGTDKLMPEKQDFQS